MQRGRHDRFYLANITIHGQPICKETNASNLNQAADERPLESMLRVCQSTCNNPCFDSLLDNLRLVHSHIRASVPYYRSEAYKERLHASSSELICEKQIW